MRRTAAALLLAAIAGIATTRASGQDRPAPTPPAPIDVARATADAAFALAFKFGEEGAAKLFVHCDEVPGKDSIGERCLLAIDFDPFEGVRWSWSRASDHLALERAALLQVPEPKGLAYELRFRFPPGRGIEITLADGFPILVATKPLADSLRISFETSGTVLGLAATPLPTTTDPRLAQALAKAPPPDAARAALADEPEAAADRPVARWSLVSLGERETPPLFAQRPVDERAAREGKIERVVLELAEMVDVPTLVVRPLAAGRLPATLLVAGGAEGKAQPAALERAAALAERGTLVVVIDLLGCGERHEIQPQDSLTTFELELVGRPATAYAEQEIRQVLAWMKQRPDVDPARIELVVDEATERALGSLGYAPALVIAPADAPSEAVAASHELVEAARFGEENVRPRYDSWLLGEVGELREKLNAPDRSLPLATRIGVAAGRSPPRSDGSPDSGSRLWWNPVAGALWQQEGRGMRPAPPEFAGPLLFCVSDFGMYAALDAATRALPPTDDAWYVTVPCGAGGDDLDAPSDGLATRSSLLGEEVARISRELGGRKLRLFGEGSVAVALLHVATLHPELVESLTALHALPSFELLLRRSGEARRAPASFGVLTQGMPAELFVQNAPARYDLEECVLALRERGIAVDWREPVDALRRPLTRHDRLAMWPRVRHAEKKP